MSRSRLWRSRTKASSSLPERPDSEGPRPDVILDVVFDSGLLFLAISNIGERPAVAVACQFDQPFTGLGGTQDMTRLPLFRRIELLAPGREIKTLLDSSAAYFRRKEPTKLAATITWRSEEGERFERAVVHDLRIYREIAYVQNRSIR